MRRFLISILALVAGAVLGVVWMWNWSGEPLVEEAATVSTPETRGKDPVALHVQQDGKALRLHWDRNSGPVLQATHAVLHITDGKHQSQMNLDPAALKSGTASYWPDGKEVSFRLELFAPGRTLSSSAQVGNAVPAVAATAKPSPFATPPPPPKRKPKIVAMSREEVVPEAQAAPSKPSKLSRAFGKIPLLRRLKKNRQADDDK